MASSRRWPRARDKTLSAGLAAAVAAMAGVPVHVMTANDHLARRDARPWRRSTAGWGCVTARCARATARRRAQRSHGCDVVHRHGARDRLRLPARRGQRGARPRRCRADRPARGRPPGAAAAGSAHGPDRRGRFDPARRSAGAADSLGGPRRCPPARDAVADRGARRPARAEPRLPLARRAAQGGTHRGGARAAGGGFGASRRSMDQRAIATRW